MRNASTHIEFHTFINTISTIVKNVWNKAKSEEGTILMIIEDELRAIERSIK